MWSVLNGIFYVLTQGCTWRNLPGDFPVWQTVYTYFRNCGCNRAEVSSARLHQAGEKMEHG
ncbi:transposase [Chamaesiphon sp.]|uniref:transposase n=1 Tax=Chamaesiphon sp. TaxID=2814140 RepID=UPI003592EB49